MRTLMLVSAAICSQLVGCAMTPNELREDGERSTHDLQQPPRAAAYCLARNAEAFRPALSDPLNAFVREPSPGSFEVLVQGALQYNRALVVVVENPGGSTMTAWLQPGFMHRHDLLESMKRGC